MAPVQSTTKTNSLTAEKTVNKKRDREQEPQGAAAKETVPVEKKSKSKQYEENKKNKMTTEQQTMVNNEDAKKIPSQCVNLMLPEVYEEKYDEIDGPLDDLNAERRAYNAKVRKIAKSKAFYDANYEEKKKMIEEVGPEPSNPKLLNLMEELKAQCNALNKRCRYWRSQYPSAFSDKKSSYNQIKSRVSFLDANTYRRRWNRLAELSTKEGKLKYKQEDRRRADRNASFAEKLKQRSDGIGYLAQNAGGIEVMYL